MNKELVGPSETAAFVIVAIGSKAFLGYPRIVTDIGLTAAWLVVLCSGLLSILFWLIIVNLLKRFPGKSLVEITKIVLGPFLGTAVNLFVFFYSVWETSSFLRLFSEVTVLTVITETSVVLVTVLLLVIAGLAVYYGLEVIFYSAYFFYPILSAMVVVVLLVLYPYYDLKMLLPVMGSGGWPLLKNSLCCTTAFGEVTMLAYLVPHFSFSTQKLKRVGIFGISYLIVFFTAIVIVYLMVFPYPTSSEVLVPFYQLSRSIFLGHYFQRVEAFFVIFWSLTVFLRIAAGLLFGVIIFRDIFKLPYYYPILPLFCLLVFCVAFTPTNLMVAVQLESRFRLFYGWLVTFLLPILLWFFALGRGKGAKESNDF